ncbi:MAG: hypothetical protein RR547_06205, partial [Raoultibacter sp.]
KRHDLARADGMYGQHNESAKARLAWSITDEALAQVNAHFEDIACTATNQGDHTEPGVLVVDEFGRLELQHDGGLTQAVRLIEQGPTERWPHALIVVREWLIDSARERFDAPWGATLIIGPDDKSREAVLTAFGQRA